MARGSQGGENMRNLGLQIRRRGDSFVLFCSGEIVRGEPGESLDRVLADLLAVGERIILNLQDVHTIDCGGLGVIVERFVQARRSGKSIEFCCVSQRVLKLMRVTGMDYVIPMNRKSAWSASCVCFGIANAELPQLTREQIFERRSGLKIKDVLRWLGEGREATQPPSPTI
jgi:anti-anti-sigma factor